MRMQRWLMGVAAMVLAANGARAADYPAAKSVDWTARDFRFHTGEVMPELHLHATTVGDPAGEPVLVLHGTAGTGSGMLNPAFAGELFGPGQPLDAHKYFIILPDAIGAGASAKPSDGLRMKFPSYDYDDMVQAQYRMLTEAMGIHHLRLVIGNSMGGMETWVWAEKYPGFMDALVPMASQPTAMAARNWMMRRLLIEAIRRDPDWNGGNYTTQPRSLQADSLLFSVATSGGTLADQALAPTHANADAMVDGLFAAPFAIDANDFIYQWDASRDFDAAPGLGQITAPLLAINSADDERNPPETGVEQRAMQQVPHGQLYLIPASAETRGHGTTGLARFYTQQLAAFLQGVPGDGEVAAK